jgi:DNA-binding beta-propeller fold protein YncE
VLPRVRELEARFPGELVVIGVHAGKYPAERRTPDIRRAVDRLGVEHPVVNDREFRTWRDYAVEAWPTIALISPDGRLVGTQAGEFPLEDVAAVVTSLVGRYDAEGILDRSPFDPGRDPVAVPGPVAGVLRYPGRVVLADGDRLFVSDTGNARVLELAVREWDPPRAEIVRVWGDGSGFADGEMDEARFAEPQGLAVLGDTLYVADRRNHAVRAVDLDTGLVTTAAGTGVLADHGVRSGEARDTPLRSPWGLLARGRRLLVTMAGSHQLFALDPGRGRLELFAGTGAEAITDGMRLRATLAQPMGLAADPVNVYFADAESSSVRRVGDGPLDAVRTVVGTGLFDHGDRDGAGDEVRLQHDEDVAVHRRGLIAADTYNDKLKVVTVGERTSAAMRGEAGSGEALSHPAGVWADDDRVIVADTGNHRIALIDPVSGQIAPFEIT